MEVVRRMQVAAELVDKGDGKRGSDAEAVTAQCGEWGVTATLKPHQAEGIAWLIGRYLRGVNVILGTPSFTHWLGFLLLETGYGYTEVLLSCLLWCSWCRLVSENTVKLEFRVLSGIMAGFSHCFPKGQWNSARKLAAMQAGMISYFQQVPQSLQHALFRSVSFPGRAAYKSG